MFGLVLADALFGRLGGRVDATPNGLDAELANLWLDATIGSPNRARSKLPRAANALEAATAMTAIDTTNVFILRSSDCG